MPGFITINPRGLGGAQNFGSAFLPASYQGTPYQTRTGKLPNIANPEMAADAQRKQLDLIQSLNREYLKKATTDAELEGVIQSYEMAFRMQSSVPAVLDFKRESDPTPQLSALHQPATRHF